MAYWGVKLLKCPSCGKHGVSLRMTSSEDYYGCRYCDWSVYTGGYDSMDIKGRADLEKANPQRFAKDTL